MLDAYPFCNHVAEVGENHGHGRSKPLNPGRHVRRRNT
jgi:hypothetical protein